MSRSKRAAFTFISSGLLTLITLPIGFVAARLLVRWLGAETLGLFTTAGGWIGQVGMLEIGVSGAMVPLLGRAVGRGKELEINDALSASFYAYRRITILSLAGAAIMTTFITHLMSVPEGRVADVRFGMVLGTLGLALLPFTPLRAFIDASQRGYVINFVLIVQSLLITVLSLLFAYLRLGVTGQFLAALLGNVPFFTALILVAHRRLKGLRGTFFASPSEESSAELRKQNRPAILCGVAGRLGSYTDNLLIGYYFGPAAVVSFVFTQKLAQMVQAQLQSVGGATWAALAELHVSGNHELFNSRITQLTRLVTVLGVTAAIPIIVFNRFFFTLWQPRLGFGGQALTILASLNAIGMAIMSLWGWAFSGTGKLEYAVPSAITGSAVNFVASVVASRAHLFCGPVLGSFIGMGLVQVAWRPWEMRRAFGSSVWQLYLAVLAPPVLALPFIVAALALTRWHPPRGWLEVSGGMVISLLPYLLAAWVLLLGIDERTILRYRFLAITRRSERAPRQEVKAKSQ